MTFCWHQRFWLISAILTSLRGCGCEPSLAVRSVLQSGLSRIRPHRYAVESSFRMPPMSSSLLNGKLTVPFLIPVADGTVRRRSPRERSEPVADLRPVPSKEFPVMAGCSSGTGLPQLTPTSFIRWHRGDDLQQGIGEKMGREYRIILVKESPGIPRNAEKRKKQGGRRCSCNPKVIGSNPVPATKSFSRSER